MGLDSIVNVQVSRQTQGVTQAGFGVPLILGPNAPFPNTEIREYTSIAAVAEDFQTSDAEYVMAQKLFSQSPRPEKVKIGLTSAAVAQVVTVTPALANNFEYLVTVGGVEYSYTSDANALATEIVEALTRLINGEEVQTLTFAPAPTAGAFKLKLGALVTANIDYNDTAADIQAALRLLTGMGNVVVTGSIAAGLEVVFRGMEGDIELLTTQDNTMEDGSMTPVVMTATEAVKGEVQTHGVVASGSGTLILTAKNAGKAFIYEVGANLAAVVTTPNNGIAEDIQAAINADNDWYFLLTTSTNDTVVEVAADFVETIKKIYLFLNSDVDVRQAGTTDIVSKLKAKSLFRTAVFYSGTPADRGDAGWCGRVAPLDPGSETWANKTIAAVTVDKWTDGQQGVLTGKNANFYIQIAGINVTQLGKTVGGEYIDIIRFIDWVVARMQETIFGDIARLDKIPFTDGGIAIIETDMRAVLEAGVRAGGIASSQDYTITVPKAKNISANDKAARRLTGMKFSFVAAGAVHSVAIQGTVTL